MKKIILTTLLASAASLGATQVTFLAEVSELFVGSTPITQVNVGVEGVLAEGFFVSDAAYSAFINDAAWETAGNQIDLTQLASIQSLLTAQTGYASSTALAIVPSAAPDSFGVFRSTLDAGAADYHAVMLLYNSDSVASLTAGDSFGVVTTSFDTLASGTETVGFNTTNFWNEALLGQSGSLTLASIVPEPSTYAALAGLCALGVVALRRRRA